MCPIRVPSRWQSFRDRITKPRGPPHPPPQCPLDKRLFFLEEHNQAAFPTRSFAEPSLAGLYPAHPWDGVCLDPETVSRHEQAFRRGRLLDDESSSAALLQPLQTFKDFIPSRSRERSSTTPTSLSTEASKRGVCTAFSPVCSGNRAVGPPGPERAHREARGVTLHTASSGQEGVTEGFVPLLPSSRRGLS